MPNYVVSLIRTFSPILAGWLLSLPLGPQIVSAFGVTDTKNVAALVAGGLGFGYYAAVRALEQRWPSLGALLGHPAKPTYDASTGTWTTAELAAALNAADAA